MSDADKSAINKLEKVKLLALDFDGTMTDGSVYVSSCGDENIRCSRRDGLGIYLLKRAGIEIVVISTEKNGLSMRARCSKLGIPVYADAGFGKSKLEILKQVAIMHDLKPGEIAYMGDDINDLVAMMYAGVKITVADGHSALKKIADLITEAKGGNHAVREVCDLILLAKGINAEHLIE